MFLSLYVINKAGGLIFQQDLSPNATKLTGNDYLRLGSTFHGLHAIAAQVAPILSGGIESLEADRFKLHCLQTQTGTKFFITAEPGTPDLETVLHAIYELYSDYVLKNPFYELEMPIRCDLFNLKLRQLVAAYTNESNNRRRPTIDQRAYAYDYGH